MEEIDLKELLKIFLEKKFIIIICVLVFAILGLVYTFNFVTPKYTAETKIVLTKDDQEGIISGNSQLTATDVTLNSKLVSTYSVLIKSKDVIGKVTKNLNLSIDPNKLIKNISVSSVGESEVISIKVTDTDPSVATKIANEITKVFADQVSELYKLNNVKVVDEAEVPSLPSNINHVKDVLIFAIVGFAIAAVYIFVENLLDNTVKSQEELEKAYNIPVLAVIPQIDFENNRGK